MTSKLGNGRENVEAPANLEEQIIVTLWDNPSLLSEVPTLTEEQFPTLSSAFRVISECFRLGIRPQISLLPPEMQMIVAELVDKLPPLEPVELKVAAERLVKQWVRSELRGLGEWLAKKAQNEVDPAYLIGIMSRRIEKILSRTGLEFQSFPVAVSKFLNWLQEGEDTNKVGIFSVKELDERTGGLRAGMLVSVLAPTSGGKTSFGLQVALRSAQAGYPVAFFSLEMTIEQLLARALANLTSISSFPLWTRKVETLTDDQWQSLKSLTNLNLPLYFTNSAWDIDDILKSIVTAKLRYGCRLFIVDYIQKVMAPRQERRELEVAYVAKELKKYALQQGVAVVALSQVTSEKEGRARESRVIEHESDVMLLLRLGEEGRMDINVRKNRMGVRGTPIIVYFNASLCSFEEIGAPQEIGGERYVI